MEYVTKNHSNWSDDYFVCSIGNVSEKTILDGVSGEEINDMEE